MVHEMFWDDHTFITEDDLGVAYRKAKADLFYERTCPYLQELCEYEENITENLIHLYDQLQSGSFKWMHKLSDAASWTVIPKSITPPSNEKDKTNGYCLCSDPTEQWEAQLEWGEDQPTALFRMVAKLKIDFHIISALWIMKVGHIYDAALGDETYGSRLRRYHSDNPSKPGKLNKMSIGTFKPYLNCYKQWRENGLRAMEEGLENEKRVAAVTADLCLFYHSLSPGFLLDQKYLGKMKIDITPNQKLFTTAFLSAIKAWAKRTPLHKKKPWRGLPVGLSASRLIANVALAELDQVILKDIQPLYYGRYVDDIILVLKDSQGFKDAQGIWSFLINRSRGLLSSNESDDKSEELEISFTTPYLNKSVLKFKGEKQKVFLLQGSSGKVLISSIARQINEQASEWRKLPELEDRERVATSIIAASGDDGEAVDSLRKTDDLSIRRAGFAIYLRDFEAFEQDLEPAAWASQRKIFFDTVCTHFLCPPKLFNYALYIPRLLGLAVSSRDYVAASQVIKCIKKSINRINKDCKTSIADPDGKKHPGALETWKTHLSHSLFESIVSALSPLHKDDREEIADLLSLLKDHSNKKSAFVLARNWCSRDMMRRPYRMRYMPYVRPGECWPDPQTKQVEDLLTNASFQTFPFEEIQSFCLELDKEKFNQSMFPVAMMFPTRPFGVGELYMLAFSMDKSLKDLLPEIPKWTLAFRGFKADKECPLWEEDKLDQLDSLGENRDVKRPAKLIVSNELSGKKVRIALGCLETKVKSWEAATRCLAEPDLSRYLRINRLVNNVISSRKKPHYLLLPELSIPARWFSRMAIKLAHRGISLIAGVDYLHHPSTDLVVANQAWASLCSDFMGFPLSIIYRQDKSKLAQHEECEIWRLAGVTHKVMSPKTNIKPIIMHGKFHFSILICSELTNIEYRSRLRGEVDAVLVPEWNKDAKSFASLVESSALDIHAFIVQCNDRKYGDSRIRAPYKKNWQRDIVRVKGGVEDYIVIGDLDVAALRKFQDNHRSPIDGPFKPVPDGFELSPSRKNSSDEQKTE